MNWVWIVEHREWVACGSRNCMEKVMDTVVMYVATTPQKAVELIRSQKVGEKGWLVVYPEPVDTTELVGDPQYQVNGRRIFQIYDLLGNPLELQPGKYEDETTH